ncbi:MAG: hypothetical protein B6U95_03125 [Thermofilum sp. ex4484_82]|nr:MAG: hypothetical protein B6U95_03125 [Thermofilum sp. ex4484_82]
MAIKSLGFRLLVKNLICLILVCIFLCITYIVTFENVIIRHPLITLGDIIRISTFLLFMFFLYKLLFPLRLLCMHYFKIKFLKIYTITRNLLYMLILIAAFFSIKNVINRTLALFLSESLSTLSCYIIFAIILLLIIYKLLKEIKS